jgi:TonB family protein
MRSQLLSTDPEPERRSKERSLAADCDDQFLGIAPTPAAAARSSRRFFAKAVAASLVAHGCLVLAFVLLAQAPHPSGPAREIPVKVATEPPAPEQRPAAPGAGEKPATPKGALQSPSREPRQTPKTEANPKPPNEARAGPNSVPMPGAPQPSASGGQGAQAKPASRDIAHKEIAQEHRLAARLEGGPRQEAGGEHQRPAQTGFALPFDSGRDSSRAVAVPLPAESGGEAMSYRVIVGGMLERVKHYPETARQRGAKGIATIRFVLDEFGRVASVSLLRSSGEADLDAESVALVNRAAPFPPPPPGAQHSFAIEVSFGMRT